MINLFVFDIGNVLLPFEHRQIARKLHHCSRIKDRKTEKEIFTYLFAYHDGIVNPYERGQMSTDTFYRVIQERFALDMSLEEFKSVWNEIFEEDTEVVVAVKQLKLMGYPLFVLSNTNELHFRYISDKYPVFELFDELILSYEVGAKKPEKKIYNEIFKKTDVAPEEILYIDDVEENVDMARSLGIQGIVFNEAQDLWRVLYNNGIERK